MTSEATLNPENSQSPLHVQLAGWMPKGQSYPAGLYIVATPIGNLADITLRALWVLQMADVVCCEDTRVTRKLLSAYGIQARLMAYHEHNAEPSGEGILSLLAAGKRVALVSDAGTPLISDPGYRLVKDAQAAGYYVTSLPGASSVLVALSLSGLPTDRFLFAGFLPAKSQARASAIAELADMKTTLVLLEAPHRLQNTLEALAAAMPDREAAIARELTKKFEELRRGTLSSLAGRKEEVKGEIVLIIAPPAGKSELDGTSIDEAITRGLAAGEPVKVLATRLAEELNLPRKQIYDRALELK